LNSAAQPHSALAASKPNVSAVVNSGAETNSIFLTPDILWNQPVPEESFAQFHDWADRYVKATADERTRLENEGIELAKGRREELLRLIQSDTQRALELSVPVSVRKPLPASIPQP